MTQISLRLVNAIRRPSGENAGSAGSPGAASRRASRPPGFRSSSAPEELARPSYAIWPLPPRKAALAVAARTVSSAHAKAAARLAWRARVTGGGDSNTAAGRSVRLRGVQLRIMADGRDILKDWQ